MNAVLPETLTIVRAHSRRLAKAIHANGHIQGYDFARTFDLIAQPVDGLDQLAGLLCALLARPDCAVIRGAILDPARSRGVRRLLHSDPNTGETPTLQDVPRRWLALDVEEIDLPEDLRADDLIGCAQLALSRLPRPFAEARCVVQASGSHGFKPDLRLRLWFWCSRPMSGTELKRWLKGTPADPSVFGAAQLIYTAAPIFAPGASDPLTRRLAELPGRAVVEVPPIDGVASEAAAGAQSERAASRSFFGPEDAGRYLQAALIKATHRIITADKRHPVIVAECRSLARFVHAGILPEAGLRTLILRAAQLAGKQDSLEIENCIAWGLAHPREGQVLEMRHE